MVNKNLGNILWVDLTDFIDWQGHFTGIQRVEYELASRFARLDNVKFFYYHPIKTAFIETNFEQIIHKAKIASGEIVISDRELKRQINISKRIIKKMKESIPIKARMRLVKIKGQIQKLSEMTPYDPTHPFKDGDTLLILGGNWAFSTFMPSIKKVKSKTKGLNSIHILYDLIPVLQPAFFPKEMELAFKRYIIHVLSSSDLSLSISECTRADALKYCEQKNISCSEIIPFRLGDDFVKINAVKPKCDVTSGEYILAVGTVEIRKNHQLIYNVLKLALSKGIKIPKIVIVGKKGWLSDSTVHLFKYDPEIKSRLLVLNNCSDKEMAWLYKNCMFTLYPSYYEGWGLPIAESLSYGKLCISSNTSSMPEVGKDMVDYFSPYDSGDCLECIVKYMNPKILQKAEIKIKQSYTPTTWDKSFEDFYQKVSCIIQ